MSAKAALGSGGDIRVRWKGKDYSVPSIENLPPDVLFGWAESLKPSYNMEPDSSLLSALGSAKKFKSPSDYWVRDRVGRYYEKMFGVPREVAWMATEGLTYARLKELGEAAREKLTVPSAAEAYAGNWPVGAHLYGDALEAVKNYWKERAKRLIPDAVIPPGQDVEGIEDYWKRLHNVTGTPSGASVGAGAAQVSPQAGAAAGTEVGAAQVSPQAAPTQPVVPLSPEERRNIYRRILDSIRRGESSAARAGLWEAAGEGGLARSERYGAFYTSPDSERKIALSRLGIIARDFEGNVVGPSAAAVYSPRLGQHYGSKEHGVPLDIAAEWERRGWTTTSSPTAGLVRGPEPLGTAEARRRALGLGPTGGDRYNRMLEAMEKRAKEERVAAESRRRFDETQITARQAQEAALAAERARAEAGVERELMNAQLEWKKIVDSKQLDAALRLHETNEQIKAYRGVLGAIPGVVEKVHAIAQGKTEEETRRNLELIGAFFNTLAAAAVRGGMKPNEFAEWFSEKYLETKSAQRGLINVLSGVMRQ